MDRRRFLKELGFIALAGATSGLAGCARAITDVTSTPRRSGDIVEKQLKQPPRENKGPDTSQDIAIVSGGSPSANLEKALLALGGIERFVHSGDRVIIKPNLLTAREPQYAVTTNPELVGALVSRALEAGASDVLVFDYSTGSQAEALEASGIGDAVRKAGGRTKILTDNDFESVAIPRGKVLKSWPFVKDIFEADVFINVPIAKTHGMAGLTLGLKNLMGVMGDPRGQIHIDFHEKIVDVYSLVKPHLTILDAHRILVRNGPTGGGLKDVEVRKTLIVGTDTVAVDSVATGLFGMKPQDLRYLMNAAARGLGRIYQPQ